MVFKDQLLAVLPPFNNNTVLIERDQDVKDIIKEVCESHEIFASDYNEIASYFNTPSVERICQNLFDFCKLNIRYRVEGKEKQTSKSPSAIIALGDSVGGDCKHYATFIGGVLDAIKRTTGRKIDWWYRFASYRRFDKTPGHVFVVVKYNGNEIWIDPVLHCLNDRSELPRHTPVDKKIKNSDMALYRISGFEDYKDYTPIAARGAFVVDDVISEPDPSLTPQMEDNLKMLLYYGVMNEDAQINEQAMADLAERLSDEDYLTVWNALDQTLNAATVGGLFDTIWRGVKKVTLAVPRNAYLTLVALNIFGTASKLHKIIFRPDGSYYEDAKAKVKDVWQNKLGGDWTNLENTIKRGYTKPRVLGLHEVDDVIGAAPAAIAAAAVAIIAALNPIIKGFLEKRQQEGLYDAANDYPYGICPDGFTPRDASGMCPGTSSTGGGIFDWIKSNPIPALAIGGAGGYLIYRIVKGKKRAA